MLRSAGKWLLFKSALNSCLFKVDLLMVAERGVFSAMLAGRELCVVKTSRVRQCGSILESEEVGTALVVFAVRYEQSRGSE